MLLALGLSSAPQTAESQYQARSWLRWRTIEAGRFTVHAPMELESWARVVASKLPAIDSAVTRVVGFSPRQHIEIVIDDPFGIPNGSAWPLIDAPRMVLWATPPDSREDIGTFVSWADMLATHEFAHLAHLLRPTRNPLQSLIWKLAPVELGPLSRKAPRWVIEGYATYLEGIVTGSGRPNGAWRATILRQWAIEGALPAYSQLDAAGGMYGGEFAYLAGSSFIEWLTVRRGDSSLVALWRRMSARRDRGFADAFTGVYGEAPNILYGRFVADITAEAKQRQAALRGDSGTMIQHLARETGGPAISRDGGRAAIMLASASRPGRVVIWRTIPEPDTLAARQDRALVASDSGDVAPYRPFPPARKPLATLHAVGNQPYQDPRFFSDGRVLVWRNSASGEGTWKPDLYVWDPQRRSVRRITRGGNVRQGDPSPDGSTIAATRCGAGKCDLVLVDARTGSVTIAAEGSDARSFHRPRFSADGRTIAVSVHAEGFWRIGLMDVASRSVRVITSDTRSYVDPAYADDSTLLAAADESGAMNIVRLNTSGTVLGRVTAVSGAAVAPERNPADGSIWFLALHARGWDVRSTRGETSVALASVRPRPVPHMLPAAAVGETRSYSPDRRWVYFPGGSLVRDGASLTLGLANTDPAGKLELLIQSSKSLSPRSHNAPLEAITASLTSRRVTPVTLSVFALRQDGPLQYTLRGGAAAGEFTRRVERFSYRVFNEGSVSLWQEDPLVPQAMRWLWSGGGTVSRSRFNNGRRTTGQLSLRGTYGRRDDSPIGSLIGVATVASTEVPITATAQFGVTDRGSPEPFVIGGNPPTLAPPGVLVNAIAQPALSPFFIGEKLETYRVAVPFFGARLYGWAGRAFTNVTPPLERVVGAEWTGSIEAIPVLGTPAARATIGIGRWMNRREVLQNPPSPRLLVAPKGNIQFYITTQFGDWTR
jgi:Tol biopolymer transport system component